MDKNQIDIRLGSGIWGTLLVLFIVLKVLGLGAVATWSWWWVLCPIWIPFCLALLFILFAFIAYIIFS